MRWPLHIVLLVAACGDPDVIATQVGADGGGLPRYCDGDGPPILVGDGITVGEGDGSSDDVCVGEVAIRTFRHALCTCEDYVTSTRLDTDSFDSAVAPYAPGGVAGPVGIDGILQSNDVLAIGGALTVSGAGGASFGADVTIAGDAAIAGDVGVSSTDVVVAGDAQIGGSIDLATLMVGGTLTVPAGETIGGTVTAGSTVRAPVTVAPPCACAPDDLVDIADFVTGHRVDNENFEIDLEPAALSGYVGDTTLELPCGRYYLGPVHGQGTLTLRATGRVAILVDGDFTMTSPLVIELVGDDAELDLLIAGLLSSIDTITAGDPAHPRRTRIYIGGDGRIDLTGGSQVALNLYAPRAEIALSGGATLYGSLFVRRLVQSAPVEIHYDIDVLELADGCAG